MRNFEKNLLIRQRRSRRDVKSMRRRRGWRRSALSILAVMLTASALAMIGLGWIYVEITSDLPAVDELAVLLDPQQGTLLQPTRLYDRSGQQLIYSLENPGIHRRALPLDPARQESLSPALIKTVLALQDPEYLSQPTLRLGDLNESSAKTIVEKLVDSLLLSSETPGLQKNLRLRLLANQALTRFGRLQILEWYINNASFGHLAYGADAAAQLYFGKSASQLDWAESALLVPVLDAPALNPLDAPAAAFDRQREALQSLYDSGVIDEEQLQQALDTPVSIRDYEAKPDSVALAFSNLVFDQLSNNIDRRRLEQGGLRVITSLDYDLQSQINCTLQIQLLRLSAFADFAGDIENCQASRLLPALPLDASQSFSSQPLAASAVILDPQTGQVLALAGDTSLLENESAALNNHPAGSLQIPFLALTGFARSLSPASLVWDIPTSLEGYTNPDGDFQGPLSLRSALVNNRLVPLTQVLLQVGPINFLKTAQSLGVKGLKLPLDDRETFFDGEAVNPLEIAYAYSAFANLGLLNGTIGKQSGQPDPILALRVEDYKGQLKLSNELSSSRPLVSAELAYLVHDVLSDEPARWPSLGYPNPLEIGRPAGALVGSTADGRSTWAAGYTRRHVVLVWLGASNDTPLKLDPRLAAGIWHALTQYSSRDLPVENWEMPKGILSMDVCEPSGMLPTAQCPSVVSEIFLEGNQPTGVDTLYRSFQINRETGRLATIFTPPELIEERTYMVVPPEAQDWSRQAGLPVPPADYDVVQAPPPKPDAKIDSPAQFSTVRGIVSLRGSAAGENFVSYSLQVGQGINPSSWISIGQSETIPIEDGLLSTWDTSQLEGLYVVRLQIIREGQRVDTFILQVTVDNTAPQVQLPYPLPGQVFNRSQQSTIILQAAAEDAVGIQRVEWWIDGRKVGEQSELPYAYVWDAIKGEHTLQVRAFDLAGNESRSEEITFTVE